MLGVRCFEKVRQMAADAGVSVAELCRRAGVARSTISHWKAGRGGPSLRTWESLTNAAQTTSNRDDPPR